jgi:hypothetical protein
MRTGITYDRLKEVLAYDPITGVFIWIIDRPGKAKKGTISGSLNNERYRLISIDAVSYKAHRLAWLYIHGELPKTLLDHINGNRDDNRIINLRLCTDKENSHNRVNINKNNTSKYMGVSWHPQLKRWWARIGLNGRNISLGTFECPKEAYEAYLNAKQIHHKIG